MLLHLTINGRRESFGYYADEIEAANPPREFPLWWGDGRSHVELHQVKNLTALSMYVRLCPHFRASAPTTILQLDNPLAPNSKKCSFHKLFSVKGLQKAEEL